MFTWLRWRRLGGGGGRGWCYMEVVLRSGCFRYLMQRRRCRGGGGRGGMGGLRLLADSTRSGRGRARCSLLLHHDVVRVIQQQLYNSSMTTFGCLNQHRRVVLNNHKYR